MINLAVRDLVQAFLLTSAGISGLSLLVFSVLEIGRVARSKERLIRKEEKRRERERKRKIKERARNWQKKRKKTRKEIK